MSASDEKKRIAIYGGSFNPPHICHMMTISIVLDLHPIDEIWLVPCFQHAFDKQLAPYDLRSSWCRKLCNSIGDACRVDDIEKRLGGESRTYNTMRELEIMHPDKAFSLVLGSDIRGERKNWLKFEELEKRYPIIWIGRKGRNEEGEDSLALPDISSTSIRRDLMLGRNVEDRVPASVLHEIRKSGWRW